MPVAIVVEDAVDKADEIATENGIDFVESDNAVLDVVCVVVEVRDDVSNGYVALSPSLGRLAGKIDDDVAVAVAEACEEDLKNAADKDEYVPTFEL